MNNQPPKFGSGQSVRVKTGLDYLREGEVGVCVGHGEEPGEVAVKFEGVATEADPFPAQVVDTFPEDDIEVNI